MTFVVHFYDATSKPCLGYITANNSIRRGFRENWP